MDSAFAIFLPQQDTRPSPRLCGGNMQPAKSMSCPYCGKPLTGGAHWGQFRCPDQQCAGFNKLFAIKPSQRARK